ncbi:MAG: hypothetical protein ABIX28_03950 [Vicinamibacterales bacterium]
MLATLRPTVEMRFCGMTLPGKASRKNCGLAALTGRVASKAGLSRVVSGS